MTDIFITKTPAFMTSDGNTYMTLEIAQRAALLKLLTAADVSDAELAHTNKVLDGMFTRLDDVKEILRATGRKARKMNGAKKRRTPIDKAVARAVKAGVIENAD